MKLAELIKDYEYSLNANAQAALAAVDWNYDVDPFDNTRFVTGESRMLEAHDALKKLHSRSPENAASLWKQHCPYATRTLPNWIFE